MSDRLVGRRAVLVAALAGVGSGCSSPSQPGAGSSASSGSASPGASPTRTASPTASPTASRAAPRLAAARPWRPTAQEVEPGAKVAAARVLEALGTTDRAGSTPRERLSAIGADPALVAQAGPLLPEGRPGVARVVYPQYGGLLTDRASVMAVVDQEWQQGTEVVRRTVTCDVRLVAAGGGWRVSELRPVPAADPARGAVPLPPRGPARRLVRHRRIDLPPAAVADVTSGVVVPELVDLLLGLAEDFSLSVAVLTSGHPAEVFGTTLTSNHTRGRAADVWAVDGVPVVTMPLGSPLLRRFLDRARALGGEEIGGPVDPDGPGGVHFANALHRDHVHVALDP